jgi:hypothetical protein
MTPVLSYAYAVHIQHSISEITILMLLFVLLKLVSSFQVLSPKVCMFLCVLHAHPSHRPSSHQSCTIYWRLQITKLLFMQYSPSTCNFLPLRSENSPLFIVSFQFQKHEELFESNEGGFDNVYFVTIRSRKIADSKITSCHVSELSEFSEPNPLIFEYTSIEIGLPINCHLDTVWIIRTIGGMCSVQFADSLTFMSIYWRFKSIATKLIMSAEITLHRSMKLSKLINWTDMTLK